MSARAPCCRPRPGRQKGAALVCALMLMMAAMLIGISVCSTVFASIASAGAERERSIAHEAAEAALHDAERDIAAASGIVPPARATQFTEAGAASFVDGCGSAGSARGLCLATSPPAWQLQDLADADNPALVPYGYYTGANLATGRGLLPARPPAYLIEKIAPPGAGASLGSFYRITAIGFGSRDATRVVLQSVVRKPPPSPVGGAGPPEAAPPTVQLPAGRIGWREIANWPQLHAQALE